MTVKKFSCVKMKKTKTQKNRNARQLDFTGQEYMKLQKSRQPPKKPRICPKCSKMTKELNGLQTKFDSVSQLVNDLDAMKLENTRKKHSFAEWLLYNNVYSMLDLVCRFHR